MELTTAAVILLAYFDGGTDGGAIAIEFANEASCKAAESAIVNERGRNKPYPRWTMCLPKDINN